MYAEKKPKAAKHSNQVPSRGRRLPYFFSGISSCRRNAEQLWRNHCATSPFRQSRLGLRPAGIHSLRKKLSGAVGEGN